MQQAIPASHLHLTRSQAQLAISSYIDPAVYAQEQAHLFKHAPKYIGHELMVPNAGDYHVLDWLHGAKTLVNRDGAAALISNVCRHRQAVMLNGRGSARNIVCPLHRWTYDLKGELLGAPHFAEKPCLILHNTPLESWRGMLFEQSAGIAKALDAMTCTADIDFSGYQFDSAHIDSYNFNWKTFVETYLEDYHVGPFHPGLNQFVDCNDLNWEFGEHFSVQTVGYKDVPPHSATPVYQRWQNAVAHFHGANFNGANFNGVNKPKYGAIWLIYYPFLMIEWYPQTLVVSQLLPTGANSCQHVVEFYYPEEIALFEREYVAAQQAAYAETGLEDKEICDRMQQGREALYRLGVDERGPYQHPMETGLAHFHEWYRRQMGVYGPV